MSVRSPYHNCPPLSPTLEQQPLWLRRWGHRTHLARYRCHTLHSLGGVRLLQWQWRTNLRSNSGLSKSDSWSKESQCLPGHRSQGLMMDIRGSVDSRLGVGFASDAPDWVWTCTTWCISGRCPEFRSLNKSFIQQCHAIPDLLTNAKSTFPGEVLNDIIICKIPWHQSKREYSTR